MQLETDQVTLRIRRDGDDGAPPVVFLHGITQSSATWQFFADRLAATHRVLRLDFRGHGGSGRTPGAYRFPGYVADAVAVLDEVVGGPALLVGHSLGGGTIAAIAQQRPDLVRAAVLEDPPLFGPGEILESSLREGFGLLRQSVPRLQESGIGVDQLAETLAEAPTAAGPSFGATLTGDALRAMAEALLELDAAVLDPVLDDTSGPEFDPTVPVEVPMLVVAADPSSPDAVTRPVDLERLAEVSPGVRSETLDGATHLIHDSKAHRDAFVELVETFLAEH